MRQKIDVIAIFNVDCGTPRPVRFKLIERGFKKTVNISGIDNVDYLGAGGVTRIVYDCFTDNDCKRISYRLMYYYREGRWEIETNK